MSIQDTSVERRRFLKQAAATGGALTGVAATGASITGNSTAVTDVQVYINDRYNVDSGFVDAAIDALENDLSLQMSFDITATYLGEYTGDVHTGDRDQTLNDYEQWIDNNYSNIYDDQHYMLLVNVADTYGAGVSDYNINESMNRTYVNEEIGISTVNVATKAWANNCWGDGDRVFKNTVMHEFGHTMNARHHQGGVLYQNYNRNITPMLTWYYEDDPNDVAKCTDNSRITDNCSNWDGDWDNHSSTLASCAWDAMETHFGDHF